MSGGVCSVVGGRSRCGAADAASGRKRSGASGRAEGSSSYRLLLDVIVWILPLAAEKGGTEEGQHSACFFFLLGALCGENTEMRKGKSIRG